MTQMVILPAPLGLALAPVERVIWEWIPGIGEVDVHVQVGAEPPQAGWHTGSGVTWMP
ncbi:hypothetical protein E8E14_007742 [Neopestalotiopsis sp. 37M]|nr:hypothetical protein E8E14_007742 [Neopestalotiopsis sp. 37M]